MTDKNRARELLALADRCEAATGSDRELDALIWCAMQGVRYISHNPTYAGHGEGDDTQVEYVEPPKRTRRVSGKSRPHAKPFTASLDAAMTLVDPRALWAHGSMEDGPFARLCWPMPDGGFVGGYHEAFAATVPLATCAASLRAIAQTEVPNDR
jgi:hypothetical protein